MDLKAGFELDEDVVQNAAGKEYYDKLVNNSSNDEDGGGVITEMEWVMIKKKMLMYQKKKRRTRQIRRVRKGSPPKHGVCIGRRGKDNCMSTESN